MVGMLPFLFVINLYKKECILYQHAWWQYEHKAIMPTGPRIQHFPTLGPLRGLPSLWSRRAPAWVSLRVMGLGPVRLGDQVSSPEQTPKCCPMTFTLVRLLGGVHIP